MLLTNQPFTPNAVDAANSSIGFGDTAAGNAWDIVLGLEGARVISSFCSATRRKRDRDRRVSARSSGASAGVGPEGRLGHVDQALASLNTRMRPCARLRAFARTVISTSCPSFVSSLISRSLEKLSIRPLISADTLG